MPIELKSLRNKISKCFTILELWSSRNETKKTTKSKRSHRQRSQQYSCW